MDTLLLILIGSLIIATIVLFIVGLIHFLPYILIVAAIIYLYNRIFRKNVSTSYYEEINETYSDPYKEAPHSVHDAIDVEYTEHVEEE